MVTSASSKGRIIPGSSHKDCRAEKGAWKKGAIGTLRDSRCKSFLIQSETYLLTCMRYIELNPVRATIVEDPAHYRWSSYRALLRTVLDGEVIAYILLAINQDHALGNRRFHGRIEKLQSSLD